MFRSAAQRLLPALCRHRRIPEGYIRSSISFVINPLRFSKSATTETNPNQKTNYTSSSSSSKTTKTTAAGFNEGEKAHGHGHEGQRTRTEQPGRAQYLDEQARVLHASLNHVVRTSSSSLFLHSCYACLGDMLSGFRIIFLILLKKLHFWVQM